uniref:Serpin domain-containing protein n=1 Tax=Catagonus wagneri TaxID=51154 RepID=A0A8C3X1G1_9CETA
MSAERRSLFLALGLLVAGLCSRVYCLPVDDLESKHVTQHDQHNGAPLDHHAVVSSNTDFAFSLYRKLASLTPNKNVVFSPLSVSMALAFLSLGARGTTLTELLEGLKFNLTETPEAEIHRGFQHLLQALSRPSNLLQLSVGNAIFVDEHLKLLDKFRNDAHELYASEVFSSNFHDPKAAIKFVNDYVKNKTKGKIPKLFDEGDSLIEMVLVNYIYLKGGSTWKTPFDHKHTLKSLFYVSENKTVEVPLMSHKGLETPYFRDEELACTVVELKYTSNDSALFILPDEGKMLDVEAKLLPETLRRWRGSLQPGNILNLPRFSISGDYGLHGTLPQLGIRKIFTHEADLSGVTGDQKLGVSKVIHKAVIDVGEEGTEAAAATGIAVLTSALHSPFIVSFDRPFLFAVTSKDTQSILFLGKVTDPSQS